VLASRVGQRGYYRLLRCTCASAAIVEVGFLTNVRDERFLTGDRSLGLIVSGLVRPLSDTLTHLH
jgi:N-acetylmuramoyl-L-alanine amidase